jgi:hypothetical protein
MADITGSYVKRNVPYKWQQGAGNFFAYDPL